MSLNVFCNYYPYWVREFLKTTRTITRCVLSFSTDGPLSFIHHLASHSNRGTLERERERERESNPNRRSRHLLVSLYLEGIRQTDRSCPKSHTHESSQHPHENDVHVRETDTQGDQSYFIYLLVDRLIVCRIG